MPQEIRVIQCFQCETFQVDMVKKTNKWQCKICNTKQSLRKEIFRGTAAESRVKVQKLNMQRGERLASESNAMMNSLMEGDDYIIDAPLTKVQEANLSNEINHCKTENIDSKWTSFLDKNTKEQKIHENRSAIGESGQSSNDCENFHTTCKRSKWTDYA